MEYMNTGIAPVIVLLLVLAAIGAIVWWKRGKAAEVVEKIREEGGRPLKKQGDRTDEGS